jgi:nucleotide-binding universal stress UspA family protein
VAREQLHQAVPDDARDWCDVTEHVVAGRSHREVLRLAAEESADLIVMGARRHGLLARTMLGSTSHRVVREASCPVLTVRPVAEPTGEVKPAARELAKSRS